MKCQDCKTSGPFSFYVGFFFAQDTYLYQMILSPSCPACIQRLEAQHLERPYLVRAITVPFDANWQEKMSKRLSSANLYQPSVEKRTP